MYPAFVRGHRPLALREFADRAPDHRHVLDWHDDSEGVSRPRFQTVCRHAMFALSDPGTEHTVLTCTC
jgi:hypothetical protein